MAVRRGRNPSPGRSSSTPLERYSPAQLRSRLRTEKEQLSEKQERQCNLTDRMDDMRGELSDRDDSKLSIWLTVAAIFALPGLVLLCVPGFLIKLPAVLLLLGGVCFALRYFSEKRHNRLFYQRLSDRLHDYASKEASLAGEIDKHIETIEKIEHLLEHRV